MDTEIERDSNAVFQALYAWSVADNDPNNGRYLVTTQQLLKVTGLTYERLEDAVAFLEENDDLVAHSSIGGLQNVTPTVRGRVRFQQIGVGGVGDTTEDSPDDIEPDVFLSHSNCDDELAKEVKQILEYNGIKTFATPSSIIRGKWEPQIEKALQNSANIWVLLTQAALEESVWAHQEFGYFYGFRHGQVQDSEGGKCRFMFIEGTPLPGLYGHFQGTQIDSFEDPAVVAEKITTSMERSFKLPDDYGPRLITSALLPARVPSVTTRSQDVLPAILEKLDENIGRMTKSLESLWIGENNPLQISQSVNRYFEWIQEWAWEAIPEHALTLVPDRGPMTAGETMSYVGWPQRTAGLRVMVERQLLKLRRVKALLQGHNMGDFQSQ